jgi:ORF6N domain-containing protein
MAADLPGGVAADIIKRFYSMKGKLEQSEAVIPVEVIERRIYLIRHQKVLLDSDLAELYAVTTFNLNKAVKRNLERFPADFMFQLSKDEAAALRFQDGMSKPAGRGGRRYLPYAFTEQGVAMLSSVLRSQRAIQVNIAIMRAFVRLREILAAHKDLARKLAAMEKKYDRQFKIVFEAIRELMEPANVPPPQRRIGFLPDDKTAGKSGCV